MVRKWVSCARQERDMLGGAIWNLVLGEMEWKEQDMGWGRESWRYTGNMSEDGRVCLYL